MISSYQHSITKEAPFWKVCFAFCVVTNLMFREVLCSLDYMQQTNGWLWLFHSCRKTITSVAFSGDGKYLATGEVRIFKVHLLEPGHLKEYWSIKILQLILIYFGSHKSLGNLGNTFLIPGFHCLSANQGANFEMKTANFDLKFNLKLQSSGRSWSII